MKSKIVQKCCATPVGSVLVLLNLNKPNFFSSLRRFSFLCFIQQVIIISLIIMKRIDPRTIATMITRGTAFLSLTLFSDAKTIVHSQQIISITLKHYNHVKNFLKVPHLSTPLSSQQKNRRLLEH